MNPGGDAAEQIVRLSLEGTEFALRITGNAAKNIAAFLMAALKEEGKTKGKARLSNMLKSGKELKVFSIQGKDLKRFTIEARNYGVLYNVIRQKNGKNPFAEVDIIARAEDAAKISRIIDKFRLASVDKAEVVRQVTLDKQARQEEKRKAEAERENVQPDDADRLLDEALSEPVTASPGRNKPENPQPARMEENALSGKDCRKDDLRDTCNGATGEKPSVREKIVKLSEQEKARQGKEKARVASEGRMPGTQKDKSKEMKGR